MKSELKCSKPWIEEIFWWLIYVRWLDFLSEHRKIVKQGWSSPHTKRETRVNAPTTGAFLSLASLEKCMPSALKTDSAKKLNQSFAKNYFLRPNNVSHMAAGRTMCHAGTKSARPSITPLPKPQWGLTLIEALRPHYLSSGRRSRCDWRKQ